MKKRDFLAAVAAVCAGAWAGTAEAQVIVRVAPPEPRVEPMPPPRRGQVWVAGYWDWNGRRYVWRPGRWMPARRGYHWREDRWVERNGGWVRERGGWARGDRDHDGVPNRFDTRPDNPYRR
jgi:hypothetical protein